MRKSLNGNWQLNSDALARYNVSNLKVKVPGSIYSDLLHYKLIEEPYFRANEAKMLDIMKDDYAYSRSFKLSSSDLRKEINLVFLGIDTISEIYVNDYLVTKTYNMHRRYIININDYIRVGENSLKVVIKSCLEFIKERVYNDSTVGAVEPRAVRLSSKRTDWEESGKQPDRVHRMGESV